MIYRQYIPILLVFCFWSNSLELSAQNKPDPQNRDTTQMQTLSALNLKVEPIDSNRTHNVKTATLLALMPGAGQIYNRKYWKLPIVYAAIGTALYFAYDNHQTYRLYLDAFYAVNGDSTLSDPFNGFYTPRQLIELQDIYRRYRDLSIILAVLGYGLQILDAHVDAHLFYYDVSDDLSLNWQPTRLNMPWGRPSIGIKAVLHF